MGAMEYRFGLPKKAQFPDHLAFQQLDRPPSDN